MKKIAIFIIITAMLLINYTVISAASETKNVKTLLSAAPDTIKAGETVILTAATKKCGSSYTDKWINAVKSCTILDSTTGTYISKAVFCAEEPGVYNIGYNINMSAGNSDSGFTGKVEKTIIVINPVTLTGADIRELVITPFYSNGIICAYKANGTVYALWSNNTATIYSSISFCFGLNETEKIVNAPIYSNGVQYNYAVTVRR